MTDNLEMDGRSYLQEDGSRSRPGDHELLEMIRERFFEHQKSFMDIRDLNRQIEVLNRKLQEAEGYKSQFLANIRNEINNPLTAILGLARRLAEAPPDPERVAAISKMIHEEAFDLDFQMRNILFAADLEAGEATPDFAQVGVGGVVEEIFDALRHKAARRKIGLRREPREDLVAVTDAEKLHGILLNLVDNALEYGTEGTDVVVEVHRIDQRLAVAVRNAGGGIAPQHRERVFDRFRQLESGSTKSHRGHGLGLSVTKALAEILGGGVSLSGGSGDDFVVTVSLPEPSADVDVTAQNSNLFLFGETERF